MQELMRLKEVVCKLNGVSFTKIIESPIPIQVLYNDKIERIRLDESDYNSPPTPLKFDISDSYTGVETTKLVRIWKESSSKSYVFEIDLSANSKGPQSFETKLEKYLRGNRVLNENPLRLTDYIKGKIGNGGVDQFINELCRRAS